MLRLLERGAPALTLIGIVVVWELSCRIFQLPVFVLPSPSAIVASAAEVSAARWMQNSWATIKVAVGGFLISVAISLPLAVMLVNSKLLSRTVVPLLIIIQSTPIAAIAPIIVVTLGAGTLPRLVITVLISFFPIVVATTTGLRATPAELIELSRALRAPTSRQMLQIRFPYSVPYIFASLKVSITLAVIGAVIAEFVAADVGLGYMIINSTSLFNLPLAFACLVILVSFSLALYQTIVLIEAVMFPWSRNTADVK